MTEKRVSLTQYRALNEAMTALVAAGEEAVRRLEESGADSVQASNYETALRGFNYLTNFIEATAGTATTERSRAILQPIFDELAQVKQDKAKYASKRGSDE
ncbi:hypothetical protein [Aureliella helgolandensis]|uniref:Uncharacterized protein n=1 Tax=Aureliella helgolandensis TaxID=2527968 RepID=A0A518G2N2_9BACT|nr:hypothetical protein [Aureliella helgolandensis]QDV22867.1 hypothetical protein Q31a_11600 [Aureliella helgolandensis]